MVVEIEMVEIAGGILWYTARKCWMSRRSALGGALKKWRNRMLPGVWRRPCSGRNEPRPYTITPKSVQRDEVPLPRVWGCPPIV